GRQRRRGWQLRRGAAVVGREEARRGVLLLSRLDRLLVVVVSAPRDQQHQRDSLHARSVSNGGTASSTRSALPPRIFSSRRGATPCLDSATVRFGSAAMSSRPSGGTTKPSKSLPSAGASSPATSITCRICA